MHLYSNSLPTITTISSLILPELFPTCLSCSNHFILSHNSLGFSGKIFVEILEAMIAGDLSNHLSDLSPVLLLPVAFTSKNFSFAKSYNIVLSNKLARFSL